MILYPSDRNARAEPLAGRAARAQAAEQELAVVPVQPAVDVRVVQIGPLLAHPPQVRPGMPSLSAIPWSHTSVGVYTPAVMVTPSGPSTGALSSTTSRPLRARIAVAGTTISDFRAC